MGLSSEDDSFCELAKWKSRDQAHSFQAEPYHGVTGVLIEVPDLQQQMAKRLQRAYRRFQQRRRRRKLMAGKVWVSAH